MLRLPAEPRRLRATSYLQRVGLVTPLLLLLVTAEQAKAQSNGCNNIPTTTPENSTGTFGGPAGVPAGTSFLLEFAYASASNTPSTITVTTSGGATFSPGAWACTPMIEKTFFSYTTVVDNETFSIAEVDAGGSGAGFVATGAPSSTSSGARRLPFPRFCTAPIPGCFVRTQSTRQREIPLKSKRIT
jgi:hypothetical protein